MAEQTLQDGRDTACAGGAGEPSPIWGCYPSPRPAALLSLPQLGAGTEEGAGLAAGTVARSLRVATLWPCALQLTEGKRLSRW